MASFADLCDVAKRNGLVVELPRNPDGEQAVWVLPDPLFDRDFEVGGTQATMRIAVVASPFMDPIRCPPEGWASQLVDMLAARGFE